MNEQKVYITPNCYENFPVVAGITMRNGGVSSDGYSSLNTGFNSGDFPENVLKNREVLYSLLNVNGDDFVFANQVHGDKIQIVSKKHKGAGKQYPANALSGIDGMITNEKNIFLTIQTADCMSIFIYCPVNNVISLLHAGWKGTELNIAAKAVELFINEYKCKPEDLIAYLGPCISVENYQVGNEFRDYFHSDFLIERQGELYLDIKKANYKNLFDAGLQEENIFIDNNCTFNNPDLFFSYRRDGAKTGRMLSFFSIL